MGRRRKGRPITGILLVDKPVGFSSNGLLQKVKWLYQAQKAGHTGALDPSATGLLPICFGEATKFTRFLLDADKTYTTTAELGVTTDTLDADGLVTRVRPVPEIEFNELSDIINQEFTGPILQIPPMYSALKRDGKKLYELAREGIELELEARPVTIFENNLLSVDSSTFALNVNCSKGTYIRTLVADIGERVGCGAHVKTLRRLQHGQFSIDRAVTLAQLEQLREDEDYDALDGFLISIDELLADLPAITLAEKPSLFFSNGNDVQTDSEPCLARVYSFDSRFLGVGRASELGRLHPQRLVSNESDVNNIADKKGVTSNTTTKDIV